MSRNPPQLASLRHFRVNRAPARSFGLGAVSTPLPANAVSGSSITMTPDQYSAAIAAAAAPYVSVPDEPITPASSDLGAALATIVGAIPAVPVPGNLPAPSGSGVTFTGLAGFAYPSRVRTGLSGLGQTTGDLTASQSKLLTQGAAITASAIALDAGIGSLAGPIGAAVGLVVGIIASLFQHKVASPPTTAAQIASAKQFIAQYSQMAGSVIGRAYPLSTMQDMTMAFCINADAMYNNAGGCGDQEGIQNSWTSQLTYLTNFFTALANTPIGSTVVLRDIPSVLGHGNTNTNVSFQFPNPGVQSPNYILGPLFAQYFYVICNIFQDSANCQGYILTAPVPQFYCDLVDWFRAQHAPAWDIPPGTVDAPVEYSTLSLQPGQITTTASTPTVPELTLPAETATGAPVSPLEEGASLTEEPNGTALSTGGALVSATSGQSTAPALSTTLVTGAPSSYASAGPNWVLIGVAAVALLLLLQEAEAKS